MIGGVMSGAVPGEVQPEVVEHGVGEPSATLSYDLCRRSPNSKSLRPHLMSVAYRLTGTVADAEDIVQEAWLRWNSAGARDPIADLRAWLTTVVSRLGLDRLRSAAHRRETLHRQLATRAGGDRVRRRRSAVRRGGQEDARFAAMVVLERLSPDQRVAFVLHDGFAVPFAEVAQVLGTNEAAARQLASRARKAVAASPPPQPDPSHNEVVGKLMAAMADRRPGRRGGAAASRRDVHRRFGWQGAHGSSGHPRRGQGRPVHARPCPTLRPVDVHRV